MEFGYQCYKFICSPPITAFQFNTDAKAILDFTAYYISIVLNVKILFTLTAMKYVDEDLLNRTLQS